MTSKVNVFVDRVNKSLICPLCRGYFRECHTIPECLHSFCKLCLIRHIFPDPRPIKVKHGEGNRPDEENGINSILSDKFGSNADQQQLSKRQAIPSKRLQPMNSCPICNISLGLRPLSKVMFDRNIQAITDKVYAVLTKKTIQYDGDEEPTMKRVRSEDFPSEEERKKESLLMMYSNHAATIRTVDQMRIRLVPHPNPEIAGKLPPLLKSVFVVRRDVTAKRLRQALSSRLYSDDTSKMGSSICGREGGDNEVIKLYFNDQLLNDEVISDLSNRNDDYDESESEEEQTKDIMAVIYYGLT